MSRKKVSPDMGSTAPKATKQDDQVMATNNSSIVSKRSVERLYYPNEPHFFRFFVKKFQRRAPLINRGYFLRLHVIDRLVRNFLSAPPISQGRKKVVVNLGCGSDVLPWQCLTRYSEHCQDAVFIDVDFLDLMQRKRRTVLETPELSGAFKDLEAVKDGSAVLLRSDRYYQVGCDLRRVKTLQDAISSIVEAGDCSFFFVAEVSITYMETQGADGVIEWASSLGDAQFCLLEQILPDGPDHPFAKTMLAHFDKLNTTLKSVHQYPTLPHQTERFLARGWKSVRRWNLWQAWADDEFLTSSERRKLGEVEPFDEWEEFALFASHYCLIHASTTPSAPSDANRPTLTPSKEPSRSTFRSVVQLDQENQAHARSERRFGAPMALNTVLGHKVVANVMGIGNNNRLQSCDIIGRSSEQEDVAFCPGGPSSRMCHTITNIGHLGHLLVGGRTSPLSPLRDCWLFNPGTKSWTRTHDLPVSLYRHSVLRLGQTSLALLLGGKDGSKAFDGCLLYHPEKGWIQCKATGELPLPVSGAILAGNLPQISCSTIFSGIFAGGLSDDGLVIDQLTRWSIDISNLECPSIRFNNFTDSTEWAPSVETRRLLCRYGACYDSTDGLIVLGGIIQNEILRHEDEILRVTISSSVSISPNVQVLDREARGDDRKDRSLFVGSSVVQLDHSTVVAVGGGATCFSMGTFWNKGIFSLNRCDDSEAEPRRILQTVEIAPFQANGESPCRAEHSVAKPKISSVRRINLGSAEDFTNTMKMAQPVVIEGLNLGSCISSWTLEALEKKIGEDRRVVVHDSSTQKMDFNAKNFQYLTMRFSEFAGRVREGGKLYLRALSKEQPADRPANLAEDFPTLAPEFVLPPELLFVAESLFSSVLRISGPVNMWLHYDVMANVYCQIAGSKRMLLFPPSDVEHLSFAPGASSSSIDVFSALETPVLSRTHPYEVTLSPGDVLYLPPLCLHTATPTSDLSIAVNVFFRDLETGYSSGRDVYGNHDYAAYEKGRQDVARIASGFQKLPPQAREFYLSRLADELRRNI